MIFYARVTQQKTLVGSALFRKIRFLAVSDLVRPPRPAAPCKNYI